MAEAMPIVHLLGVLESLGRDLGILARSVSTSRASLLASIAGDPKSWQEPHELSEFTYFRDLLVSQWSDLELGHLTSPGEIWRRIKSLDRVRARLAPLPLLREAPCSIRHHAADRFPKEAWFFVNGVATDRDILRVNGVYLSRLFHRPIELIYNPTHGIVPDLLECVTGRTFDYASGTAAYALERVASAIENPSLDRVILMGHSQGGIIVSNVVAGLTERFTGDASLLGKLEVYTFASACDFMPVDGALDTPTRRVPYLEHFANTGDLVAKLGVLEIPLDINGRVYRLEKAGHLLNAHYLPDIGQRRYAWRPRGRATGRAERNARLYSYLGGETPERLRIHHSQPASRKRRSNAKGRRQAPPPGGVATI